MSWNTAPSQHLISISSQISLLFKIITLSGVIAEGHQDTLGALIYTGRRRTC